MKATNATNSKKQQNEIKQAVNAFRAKMSSAADALYEASVIYADAVTNFGDDACKAFDEAYPGVTKTTWDKMRLVAKGALVPEALLISDRIAARIGYMPIDEQKKVLGGKKTVQVVTPRGKVETKAFPRLTAKDEDAVFSQSGRIRTVAEQRKWYAEKASTTQPQSPAYEVRGNILIVYRATKFGKTELLDIVRKMK